MCAAGVGLMEFVLFRSNHNRALVFRDCNVTAAAAAAARVPTLARDDNQRPDATAKGR